MIDHIFVDENLYQKITEYCAVENYINFSDHLPVICQLHTSAFNSDLLSPPNITTKQNS